MDMDTITLSIPLAAYGTVATAAALEGVDVSTYVKSHVLTADAALEEGREKGLKC